MSATTSGSEGFSDTRWRRHPHCWVCSPANGTGLAIGFAVDETGAVEGTFPCDEEFTGYPDYLHGGVTSALLDGAMTNCLMARGTPGLTARLEVRFLKPALIGRPATVRGWWEKSRGPLHILGAELKQDGEIVATAAGRFMAYPETSRSGGEGEDDEEDRHHHL